LAVLLVDNLALVLPVPMVDKHSVETIEKLVVVESLVKIEDWALLEEDQIDLASLVLDEFDSNLSSWAVGLVLLLDLDILVNTFHLASLLMVVVQLVVVEEDIVLMVVDIVVVEEDIVLVLVDSDIVLVVVVALDTVSVVEAFEVDIVLVVVAFEVDIVLVAVQVELDIVSVVMAVEIEIVLVVDQGNLVEVKVVEDEKASWVDATEVR